MSPNESPYKKRIGPDTNQECHAMTDAEVGAPTCLKKICMISLPHVKKT